MAYKLRHGHLLNLFLDGKVCQMRKEMSHKGALRTKPGEARHCLADGEWYWDPGNTYYSRAFRIAFPNVAKYITNEEKLGDILEALLGKSFDDSRNPNLGVDNYKDSNMFICMNVACFVRISQNRTSGRRSF